jgi:hypothetical protein
MAKNVKELPKKSQGISEISTEILEKSRGRTGKSGAGSESGVAGVEISQGRSVRSSAGAEMSPELLLRSQCQTVGSVGRRLGSTDILHHFLEISLGHGGIFFCCLGKFLEGPIR